MLLPLMGLMFGIVASALLGAVVIALHPSWKITFKNLAWFVVGAFAGAIASSLIYTWLFADENRVLHSSAAVIGFLATLGMATLLGGTFALFIGRHYFTRVE